MFACISFSVDICFVYLTRLFICSGRFAGQCRRSTMALPFALVSLMLFIMQVGGNRMENVLNNLLAQDDSMTECSAAFHKVQENERLSYAPYPPDMKGSWVSQE